MGLRPTGHVKGKGVIAELSGLRMRVLGKCRQMEARSCLGGCRGGAARPTQDCPPAPPPPINHSDLNMTVDVCDSRDACNVQEPPADRSPRWCDSAAGEWAAAKMRPGRANDGPGAWAGGGRRVGGRRRQKTGGGGGRAPPRRRSGAARARARAPVAAPLVRRSSGLRAQCGRRCVRIQTSLECVSGTATCGPSLPPRRWRACLAFPSSANHLTLKS